MDTLSFWSPTEQKKQNKSDYHEWINIKYGTFMICLRRNSCRDDKNNPIIKLDIKYGTFSYLSPTEFI